MFDKPTEALQKALRKVLQNSIFFDRIYLSFTKEGGKVMQLASLILGILGFLISFSFFKDLGIILSILGIVLGGIALKKTESKGMCLIAIMLSFVGLISCFSGGSSNNTSTNSQTSNTQNVVQTLKVGDTWNVEGQWKLTIHSVTPTQSRNQYAEKKPAEVFLLTYSYENIGYYNDFYDEDKLFFDLNPDGDASVIDSAGVMAYSYPADKNGYAQETPNGAKCSNAQAIIAVDNESNTLTMNISKYDGKGKKQSVKYILDVQ